MLWKRILKAVLLVIAVLVGIAVTFFAAIVLWGTFSGPFCLWILPDYWLLSLSVVIAVMLLAGWAAWRARKRKHLRVTLYCIYGSLLLVYLGMGIFVAVVAGAVPIPCVVADDADAWSDTARCAVGWEFRGRVPVHIMWEPEGRLPVHPMVVDPDVWPPRGDPPPGDVSEEDLVVVWARLLLGYDRRDRKHEPSLAIRLPWDRQSYFGLFLDVDRIHKSYLFPGPREKADVARMTTPRR